MRRGREASALGNPVLVGALTVLVTIVAVTLAYNANNGLPFVPQYALNLQVRNASEVTHDADVRIGGSRIGFVNSVTASRDASGRPIAVLNLKLEQSVKPLPVNSTFTIRLKAAIGLKYVEITPGNSARGFSDGAMVPVGQSSSEVDLDQFLSMFTPPTRTGVAASTIGYGAAFAGRGGDVNNAIGAFVPLLGDLTPVARNLAAKRTDLGGFFRGLEQFSSALAPVAQTQATLYVNLNTTFRALATVAVPFLQQWISQTPPTFTALIDKGPVTRPFLTDTAAFFRESLPGAATLQQSAPVLADAFAAGTRNLPGTAALDQRVTSLSKHLARYGETPAVANGLDRLTLTATSLRSPLSFLTPVQSSCNYVTLFLRNISSLLSDPAATGTTLNFLIVAIDDVLGGEAVPSSRPYTTPALPTNEHGPVHVDPYPNTNSPGQTAECSAGNEPYSVAQASIGNPAGNVGLKTEQTTRSKG